MIRTQVKNLTRSLLKGLAMRFGATVPEDFSFTVDIPRNPENGDFSIDIAFRLAKSFARAPMDIGAAFIEAVEEKQSRLDGYWGFVRKVELVKPGFINFRISDEAWHDVLNHIQRNQDVYGQSQVGEGEKVLLEYVSANPTGPLTIAHGRQACLGDVLANVMKKAGFNVSREYYLNDGGRQIQKLGQSVYSRYLDLLGVENEFPEDGYQGDYIKDISKEILDKEGENLKSMSAKEAVVFCSNYAKDNIMETIKEDLKAVRVEFDEYFSEQTLYPEKVEEIVEFLKNEKRTYESEDALWFETTKLGDDKDRVLRKSSGDYTYLVPDIAYHREKFQRGFQRVINLLGPDHHGYIKRLKASVEALGYNPDQLEVLIVQLTTLFKNGEPFRMSTRAGNFVSLRELIDEVGADATRFFFLMRKVNSHVDFDIELAKEKSQDNPVFYLQYAHARIASIMKKADRLISDKADLFRLGKPEEMGLIKLLHDFPHQIAQTALGLEPYRLVDYLNSLAACFHRFYTIHKVITEDNELTDARLLLCDCTRVVLRNGLKLLGVSHPDSM